MKPTHTLMVAALAMSFIAGCGGPKLDPAALELLRQQQAAEAARKKAKATRQSADKAFERLDRDTQ